MKRVFRKHKRLVIILLLFISIGFAYLSTQLDILGNTLLKANTWDVHFENVQVSDGSVTSTDPMIDTNRTSVTFSALLDKPGDFYEFTVDAVNGGTIDAMISNYTDFNLTESQKKYLETSVTYEDGEDIKAKQQLLSGDTAVYKIKVSYKKDLSAEDLPEEVEEATFTYIVTYVQRDKTSIERKAENTLYNVLRKDYENKGYSKLYAGAHQDSMNASKSIKNIYFASTDFSNNYNVLFGNYCWQIIRTTDTGGVKLLYNGEPSNRTCISSRPNHSGYSGSDNTITLNNNYYYSSSYNYDSSTKKYSLDGDIIQSIWNDENYSNLIGKYTCLSTSPTDTCSTMYLITYYHNSSKARAFSLSNNTLYSDIGKSYYNENNYSYSSFGYMYDNKYDVDSTIGVTEEKMSTSLFFSISSLYIGNYAYYSDSYTFSNNSYYLTDPIKVNNGEGNSDMVGKYMLSSENSSNYYVNGTIGDTLCYVLSASSNSVTVLNIKGGKTLDDYSPFVVSDSYSVVDNNYILNNYDEYDFVSFFNNDYNNVLGKFVCSNYTKHECSNLFYISKANNYYFSYIPVDNKVLISKERDGFKLKDTIVLDRYQWFIDKDNYSDYIYTCNNLNDICTKNDLVIVDSFSESGYYYSPYRFYGSGVSWDGEKYSLINTISFESYNDLNSLAYHHYFCLDYGETTCSTVAYMVDYNGSGDITYLLLENGNTLSDVIEELLTSNIKDSLIKFGIDKWYEKNFIQYSSYLDDTIFCNNRYISKLGSLDPNGGYPSIDTSFGHSSISQDSDYFYCNNITDRFSISNDKAKLKYSIALPTYSEIKKLEPSRYLGKSYSQFYTMSPAGRHKIYEVNIPSGKSPILDGVSTTPSYSPKGIRPVIALKKGIVITSGNGSQNNPYYIKTEYDS